MDRPIRRRSFGWLACSALFLPGLTAQCANQWVVGEGLAGLDQPNGVRDSVLWDPDGSGPLGVRVVVTGNFAAAGNTLAQNIAAYDPVSGNWTNFGPGLSGNLMAVTPLANGKLVVGGTIAATGNVARWDGSAWHPLGSGVVGTVYDLATLPNGDVVAAGVFSSAGGAVSNIARWDGTTWSPLGSIIAGSAGALAVAPNGDLYAGGTFTLAGGQPVEHLARWDGVAWSPVGLGPFGGVQSLVCAPNGDLFAGLVLTATGATHVARYHAGTWQSLGQATGDVLALRLRPNGTLVASGSFHAVGGVPAESLAEWSGSAWQAIGGFANSIVGRVEVLPGGDLFVGGSFTSVGGVPTLSVARYDGTAWHAPRVGTTGFSVQSLLACSDGSLCVGGRVTGLGGVSVHNAARFDGVGWQPLGTGWDLQILAFAEWNGELVAGGMARNALHPTPDYLARFDGTAWQSLGAGVNNEVYALQTRRTGELLAGGVFWLAGGQPCTGLAQWDGVAWQPVGNSLVLPTTFPRVRALLELPNGDLVAGGSFTAAGPQPLNHIGRWNGSAWSPLGSGFDQPVLALARLPNGDVVAGGAFTIAGGQPVSRIARWNGSTWSPLGAGLNGNVNRLTVLPNGDLVAAGAFNQSGAVFCNRLARWNGSAWSPVGPGPTVGATTAILAMVQRDGELVVGGGFAAIGTQVAPLLGTLRTTCPATVATVGTGCTGAGGQNVLAAVGLPWLGATFVTTGSGLAPGALVAVVTGLSDVVQPLAAVTPLAGLGCDQLVGIDAVMLAQAPNGLLQAATALPNTAVFAGVVLRQQMLALELDGQGAALAVTSTNALRCVLGRF